MAIKMSKIVVSDTFPKFVTDVLCSPQPFILSFYLFVTWKYYLYAINIKSLLCGFAGESYVKYNPTSHY